MSTEKRCWRFPEMYDGTKVSGNSVLGQIMSRVQPDGSVIMNWGESLLPDPFDASQLSPEEREVLQLDLAHTLYNHVKNIWTASGDRIQGQINQKIEPHIALNFSRFRSDPNLLEGAAQIVDEIIETRSKHPSETPYPSIY